MECAKLNQVVPVKGREQLLAAFSWKQRIEWQHFGERGQISRTERLNK
jgi:hypothetical protein